MLSKSEKESILNDCEVDITESTISLCEMVERAVLAKASQQGQGEPIAKVVSKYGDPEAFGEREIKLLSDIQNLPYGTELFTQYPPPQAAALPECYKEEWKRNVMLMWSCVRKHDSSIPSDVLDFMREFLLAAAPKPDAETKSVLDGYRLVPFPLPEPEQVRAAQTKSEIGRYICDNWAGAYDCIYELYRVMIEACPQGNLSEQAKSSSAPQVGQCLELVRDLSSVIRSAIDDKRIKEGDQYIVYGGSRGTISNLLEWADAILAEGNQ